MRDITIIDTPYIVIQTTQPPYSTGNAIDSLEAALAATNIGLRVIYIFVGDGVFQLLNNQQNELISHKSVYKKLTALPLFDVNLIFAQGAAIRANQISVNEINLDVNIIEGSEMVKICARAQHVLVF
ncbi:MAG: tRNA 2-thiouridine synthesizing protein C [Alphaproteobacteria bacterium]|jgi:tRNA 2-thiouridine synthesizing protein C